MHFKLVINFVGMTLLVLGLFMLLPVAVALVHGGKDTPVLLISSFLAFSVGGALYLVTRRFNREEIGHRDAFIVVTVTWLSMSLFASVPYLLAGTFSTFTDAYFESMSGFTTTGASVLTDVEVVPKGIMFWRCLTQWIGGMGIIVLALAILPMLGAGGMQLFRAEVPDISADKLKPRIIDTAKALWFIYFGLTLLNIVLLMAGGMDWYDATCHAFTTMATGGFSTKNASIGHYGSAFIDYVTTLFMFLAGINFALYFSVLRGKPSRLWRNNEFRFYGAVTLTMTLLITADLWGRQYNAAGDAFRYAIFQVVSIMTTTGYATADYEKWSVFSQMTLVMLMFLGGMIGSTGGGIKQVRILLMLKQGYREIFQLIHPRAVTTVKLDDRFLSKEMLGSIWGFVFLFLGVCAVATVGMTALGIDLVTSATTVITAICNVGPALGEAGPAENFASLPAAGKWILIFCMLAGRLEIYTVLILFVPAFWRR